MICPIPGPSGPLAGGTAPSHRRRPVALRSMPPKSNAAGKRPRHTPVAPPAGCFPPQQGASKYSEGHRQQSADGSTWEVAMNISSINSWKSAWVYVDAPMVEAEAEMDWHIAAYLRKEEGAAAAAECTPSTPAQLAAALPHPAAESRRVLLRLQVGCGVSGAAVVSAHLAVAHVVLARDAPPFGSSTPAAGSATDGKRSRQPAGGYSAYGHAGEYKRPGEAANKDRAPCRHCGKICWVNGRGLKQHEAICARRLGADGPASAASAAAPHLSSAEHAQLVQRLEEHMATHGLSQERVAKAVKFSSAGKLSMWLGRCRREQTLGAATMVEQDARIAAYLDEAPILPAPTSTAATASAAAPRASSTEHAQLVQRLEEHMATHGLSQEQVAKAMKLLSCVISMWSGRARAPLSAATRSETDARVAAYLDDSEATPFTTGHLSFGEHQRPYDALEAAILCTRSCRPICCDPICCDPILYAATYSI